MAKQLRKLLFLKSTGVLIGEINHETDHSVMDFSKLYIKDVELDEEAGDYWFGDYATGRVESKLDKPVVTESAVKYATNLRILTEYPIHKQLNILIDMLDKSSLEKTPEFVAMKSYLEQMRTQHQEKCAAFSSDQNAYVWISESQEHTEFAKKVA